MSESTMPWANLGTAISVQLLVLACASVPSVAAATEAATNAPAAATTTEPTDHGPRTVMVFSGRQGGSYDLYLRRLCAAVNRSHADDVWDFRFINTDGSLQNYLSVQATDAGVSLVQEDVAEYGARTVSGRRGEAYPVRAVARAFHEYIFLIARPGFRDFRTVRSLGIGPASSGSAFTFQQLMSTWIGILALEPKVIDDEVIRALGPLAELAAERPSGSQAASLQRRVRSDAAFRVSGEPPNLLNVGLEIGVEFVQLGSAQIQRAVVEHPVYREATLNANGKPYATLAVDALLVVSARLPSDLVVALAQAAGSAQSADEPAIHDGMRLPSHPEVIRLSAGAYPYSSFAAALVVLLLCMGVNVWIWHSGSYARWLRRRSRDPNRAGQLAGRHHVAIIVILSVFAWTVLATAIIKYLEVEELLQGHVDVASRLWRMELGDALTWMFVLITMGYEQNTFPTTNVGQWLALAVQGVAVGGVLFAAGSLSLGVVEDLMRRVMIREVKVTHGGHIVILNWRPAAALILAELERAAATMGFSRRIVLVGKDIEPGIAASFKTLEVDIVDCDPRDPNCISRASIGSAWKVIVLRVAADPIDNDAGVAMICIDVHQRLAAARTGLDGGHHEFILAELDDRGLGNDLLGHRVLDVGAAEDFELDLLTQTLITPQITKFYDDLLTYSDDTVELYGVGVPSWLLGKADLRFGDAVQRVHAASLQAHPDNPMILVGIHRKSEGKPAVHLNPRQQDENIGPLTASDQLIVLSYTLSRSHLPQVTLEDAADTIAMVMPAGRGKAKAGVVERPKVVICSWSSQGAEIVRRLREAEAVTRENCEIVIISDRPVQLEASLLSGVVVKPLAPYAAGAFDHIDLAGARAVCILADRDREYPDNHTLLVAMRVQAALRRKAEQAVAAGRAPPDRPSISAEVVDPRQARHFRDANVDEVVCAKEMLYRAFAQATVNPATLSIFQQLLRVSDDTNEVYLVPVSPDLLPSTDRTGAAVGAGVTIAEAMMRRARERSVDNPALVLGYRGPDNCLVVNPRGEQLGEVLTSDHRLLVMLYQRQFGG